MGLGVGLSVDQLDNPKGLSHDPIGRPGVIGNEHFAAGGSSGEHRGEPRSLSLEWHLMEYEARHDLVGRAAGYRMSVV